MRFKCHKIYDIIRDLHPHALVSYKQGLLGTEDFFAPEHDVPTVDDNAHKAGKINEERDKIIEICTTMIDDPVSWGYMKDAEHKTVKDVWKQLQSARKAGANLLLNTGPMGDGSLEPVDEKRLREVGKRLQEEGFPGETGT